MGGPFFSPKNIFKHRKKVFKVQIYLFSQSLSFIIKYAFRWNQSINCSSIEIVININLKKALKFKFLATLLKKLSEVLGIKAFYGPHDDIKIIGKKVTLSAIGFFQIRQKWIIVCFSNIFDFCYFLLKSPGK